MLAVCPSHCDACAQSGEEIKCNAERCDFGYGRSLNGQCEGDLLQLLLTVSYGVLSLFHMYAICIPYKR